MELVTEWDKSPHFDALPYSRESRSSSTSDYPDA